MRNFDSKPLKFKNVQIKRDHERSSHCMECYFWYVIVHMLFFSVIYIYTYTAGLMFFGFVFLTSELFTSSFSMAMSCLVGSVEMGYMQAIINVEKSSNTDLFLRFCVYLAISICGVIVNFNFGFVLLLAALYTMLGVSGYVLSLSLFLFLCFIFVRVFAQFTIRL